MTSSIGLLARDLENTAANADVIETCKTLAAQIDDHIREQNFAGYTHADTPVPQQVEVAGLSTRDAQLMVYSELLLLYSGDPDDTVPGKGFRNVKLRVIHTPRGEEWIFHTEWQNMMTAADRREKLDIIERFTERMPYVEPVRAQRRPMRATNTTRAQSDDDDYDPRARR